MIWVFLMDLWGGIKKKERIGGGWCGVGGWEEGFEEWGGKIFVLWWGCWWVGIRFIMGRRGIYVKVS